jgi:peptidoglycan/LPS O-acetylase OafA/YrhL
VFFAHAALLNNPLDLTAQISFFENDSVAKALAHVFAPAGFVGVSFFFVLSGFVLTWSRKESDRPQDFLRRRLLKIYPNHIVTWGLAMALFAAAYTPMHAWLPNLFLVHTFSSAPDTFSSVNVPAWSLCSELLFYILFPFLIRPIMRIRENRLWWWAGFAVAGVAAVALIAKYIIPEGVSYPLAPMPMTQMWFGYLFPPARLFEFFLGILLARIVAAGRWPKIGAVPVTLVAIAGYIAAVELPSPYNFALTTIVPISVIICAAASADVRGEKTLFSGKTMVWLGTVSFAFYMIQAVPIFWGRLQVFGGETFNIPVSLVLIVLMFAVTLAAAWVLYRFVELPIMRRWSRSRAKAPVATPDNSVPERA